MSLLEHRDLGEREADIVALADRLAAAFADRAGEADRTGRFPLENKTDLGASGYLALTVPRELGGRGASLFEFVLAQERLGRGDASAALVACMHGHIVGAAAEARSWPTELFAAVCEDIVARGALLNSAASEPEMGSPSRGGRFATRARRVGEGWRLTGRKTWTTGAPALDYALVAADTEEGGGWRFLVTLPGEGVRIEETWSGALALRGSGSHDLVLEDAFVPAGLALPPIAGGASGPGWFWGSVAATYLGVGWAAVEGLAAYAAERAPTALGRPISSLPRVRAALGEMELSLAAARAVLHGAARAWSAHPERRADLLPRLAAAKVLCTNAAVSATDAAMRAAGGAALTGALPLERLFRDARAGLAHPPSEETTLEMIAAARLGMLE